MDDKVNTIFNTNTDVESKKENRKKLLRYVFLGIIVVIFILDFFVFKDNKATQKQENNIIREAPSAKDQVVKDAYFPIRKTNIPQNVLGYYWNGEKMVYANSTGIYEAITNIPLLNESISSIVFTHQGNAVLSTPSGIKVFNKDTKITKQMSFDGIYENIQISNDGNYLSMYDGSSLLTFNVEENKEIARKDSPVFTHFWTHKNRLFIFDSHSKKLHEYDEKLNIQSEYEIDIQGVFLGISSDGSSGVFTNDKEVILENFEKNNRYTFKFEEGSTFHGNWINNNNFGLVQTLTDKYGRTDDYIWLLSKQGERTFLHSSIVIPQKINTDRPVYSNSSQNVVSVVENNGGIWLISLLSGQVPSLTSGGVSFFSLPKDTTHDHFGP